MTEEEVDQMAILKSIEEIDNFISKARFALLYFSSDSCGVCASLFPKIEVLLKEYPAIELAKADIGQVPAVAGAYSIFTIPAILVFMDGKEIIREARHISVELLKERIERYYEFAASSLNYRYD